MSEAKHTVRIHQPFAIPKQWVAGPVDAMTFTEDQCAAGKYTMAEVVLIHDTLHQAAPNAVIQTDGL